ncbi:MAG TPA: hypothetical protein VLJ39_15940 [Tepidisphaeraceae bacterium]|nr:hypothetical protein [Tepidisphaeraceae bacterium]
MRLNMNSAVTGIGIAAALAVGGCGAYHERGPAPEPVAVGYPEQATYDDTYYADPYYNQGYYVGNDWHWRDREGHEQHEARAEHERRMNAGRERVQAGGRQEERAQPRDSRGGADVRQQGGVNARQQEQRGGQHNAAQPVAPRNENAGGYHGNAGAAQHAPEGRAAGAQPGAHEGAGAAGHGGAGEAGHGGAEAGHGEGDGHR